MKSLCNPTLYRAPDAWGRDNTSIRQVFEVEASDVRTVRMNYQGYRQPGRIISNEDVGKVIEVITCPRDPLYNCWYFGTVLPGYEGYPK